MCASPLSVGQKLPSDWEAKVAKFRLYLRENLFGVDSFNVQSDEEFLGFA